VSGYVFPGKKGRGGGGGGGGGGGPMAGGLAGGLGGPGGDLGPGPVPIYNPLFCSLAFLGRGKKKKTILGAGRVFFSHFLIFVLCFKFF